MIPGMLIYIYILTQNCLYILKKYVSFYVVKSLHQCGGAWVGEHHLVHSKCNNLFSRVRRQIKIATLRAVLQSQYVKHTLVPLTSIRDPRCVRDERDLPCTGVFVDWLGAGAAVAVVLCTVVLRRPY